MGRSDRQMAHEVVWRQRVGRDGRSSEESANIDGGLLITYD